MASHNPNRDALDIWLAGPAAADHFDATQLTPQERQRFSSLRTTRGGAEFAVSRALLAHAGLSSTASPSLSHSAGCAAIASGAGPLGVDLEQHRPRDALALARFAFSTEESRLLETLPTAQRLRTFYGLWVMKEAMAKALQLPLMQALRGCVFIPVAGRWHGTVVIDQPWQIIVFEPREHLSLAVARIGPNHPSRVRTYEWPPQREVEWKRTIEVQKEVTSG